MTFEEAKIELSAQEQAAREARWAKNRAGVTPEMALQNKRYSDVEEWCNIRMEKTGCSYNDAFAACKIEKPELFGNITYGSNGPATKETPAGGGSDLTARITTAQGWILDYMAKHGKTYLEAWAEFKREHPDHFPQN